MKLDYNVYWVEDHFREVTGIIRRLTKKFSDAGFSLNITQVPSISSQEIRQLRIKLNNYNPYDLVLFDFELGADETGVDLAHELRLSIFTDMILYTGQRTSDLKSKMHERGIEGSYAINRSEFVDAAWRIIEDQIKRFSDINSMRGVILDEMSYIDSIIREIFCKKYKKLDPSLKESHLRKMKKIYIDKSDSFTEKKDSICLETLPEYIQDPKHSEFNIVLRRISKLYSDHSLFQHDGPLQKKQTLRNNFAHNMSEFDESNGTISLVNNPDKVYTYEDFAKIRKELRDIHLEINKLAQSV